MDRVGPPPVGVRHQRHDAEHTPDGVVAPAAEERAVTAVVLEDEEAHEEAGHRQRQQEEAVAPAGAGSAIALQPATKSAAVLTSWSQARRSSAWANGVMSWRNPDPAFELLEKRRTGTS